MAIKLQQNDYHFHIFKCITNQVKQTRAWDDDFLFVLGNCNLCILFPNGTNSE